MYSAYLLLLQYTLLLCQPAVGVAFQYLSKNALLPKLLTEMNVHVCIKIHMRQGYMQLQG